METSGRSSSNRYVIEDSIARVTSDGEPHEVMTMVAVGSGLIAAIIILFILISIIGNRNDSNDNEEEQSATLTTDSSPVVIPILNSTRRRDYDSELNRPKLISVSSISETLPTPEGEINLAFIRCTCDPKPGPSGICTSRL